MTGAGKAATAGELPLWRLYLLRAMYLVMAAGLGIFMWPSIVSHRPEWPLMSSVVACMLGALGLLSVLGLRYPVRMLPLLLFETAWKLIWLIAVALPLWRAGRFDAATASSVRDCLPVVLVILVVPWPYVVRTYLLAPGDRWR
ncbi:hypothetical protein OF829_14680 [Sphingomonas sp. LB-2]|uniref:hypothetical protein n=1 Tax=Sphingomonas caeni TaxID=2984949 RepID=UPI00222F8CF6|nr:hypothetical protein [Sphingomonas caeni]MCW3848484.1 hypothetical protein [Sphingomonas caeni]